jgi:hypothetical protein
MTATCPRVESANVLALATPSGISPEVMATFFVAQPTAPWAIIVGVDASAGMWRPFRVS